jgi:hypothetical protein
MDRQRFAEVTAGIFGADFTKRVLVVKGVVTATFLMWMVHPDLATPVAIMGNLIWLWINPENEKEKIEKCVEEFLTRDRDTLRNLLLHQQQKEEEAGK